MNRKDTTRIVQEDGKENGRFVLFENDIFAGEMIYTWKGKTTFSIDHTTVDPNFGGKGYGKLLVIQAVEFAKENGFKIEPLCSQKSNRKEPKSPRSAEQLNPTPLIK